MTISMAATGLVMTGTAPVVSAAVDDQDWLGVVNSYRSMSGLGPLAENPTWSAQGRDHSRYMLLNGISHDEVPGKPGYTEGGHTAGMSGNVAVSSAVSATPRSHIDLWMTGPFHAIGVLRHNLTTTGFGLAADPATSPWRSGATLDVVRGINQSQPRPSTPIVFPGRDTTVPLSRFITEQPNPVSLCGWTGSAGLPLIAMMPVAVSSGTSTLVGPNGPVETCTLHPGNTSDATARALMASENAVVVVPRDHLATGRHTATVTSNGGQVTWSFTVDPTAPLPMASAAPAGAPQPASVQPSTQPLPATSAIGGPTVFEPVTPYRHADSRQNLRVMRLTGGVTTPVPMAGDGVTAVSANFTVAGQTGPGHLRVFACSPTLPEVSTVNYEYFPAANQAIVPLSAAGELCLYATTDTHVLIDVNGRFVSRSDAATTFNPRSPTRVYDTRPSTVPRLSPGEERTVQILGVPGGAPSGATAVAMNITAVEPVGDGWIRVFPCSGGAPSDVSSVNFSDNETRANSAIVPLSAAGTVCVEASVVTDVIIDLNGHFTTSGGHQFTALSALRILDTRSTSTALNPLTGGAHLGAGQVGTMRLADRYGIPADAEGVAINVTVVDPSAAGFVTVYPCGERPNASNLNFRATDSAIANGAMVGLSAGGDLCFVSDQPVHLLIDISGVWS